MTWLSPRAMAPVPENRLSVASSRPGRTVTADRGRWSLIVSLASHGLCLLAIGTVLLARAPRPVPEPAFDVVFAPPLPPPPPTMVSSAAIARAPGRQIVEPLPANLRPVMAAGTRPQAADNPRQPAIPRAVSPARRHDSPNSALQSPALQNLVPQTATLQTAATHENAYAASADEMPRDLLATLQARIRQAVQDATIYPGSARMMRREGRAEVGFAFTGGTVSHVALVISSGSHILDTAALSAVQRAAMPTAPARIGNRMLPLQVWVQFSLASDG